MRNQILWAVVIGLHVAAVVTAGGCRPSLGMVCGHGWCSEEEICVDPQAAQPVCVRGTCGNDRLDVNEECDDGNNTGGDGCSPNCMVEVCGNGIPDPGEQCDDGNTMGGDGCSAGCTLEVCGNGTLDRAAGEQCDDGNTMGGDGCSADCILEHCGDGVLDLRFEQCDDSNTIDGDGCSASCTLEVCGNAILDRAAGEQCDDGNTIDGDGCSANCRLEHCGNGIRDTFEQCDDGNHQNGDGCEADCTVPACGNRILDRGEQCDDGNRQNGDGCEADCTLPACGNRILDPGEQCDDGNVTNGDGCSAVCMFEQRCGNGVLDSGEQCDDGNHTNGDGCEADCTLPVCGNRILDPFEKCDDGNAMNFDGCRHDCTASLLAYIKASNADAGDQFGVSVALSADGSTLAVGALFEDSVATGINGNQADNSAIQSGAVYVFTRSGATWIQQAYLKASNTGTQDKFGWSIALSADGSTLAVGAVGESSAATGVGGDQANDSASFAGAVYVFTRSGVTWSQQAYIKASNTDAGDEFGFSVALSADGTTLAVGAIAEGSAATGIGGKQTDNSADAAGAVYVFTRSGVAWSQQAYVKASNAGTGDQFGFSVALSSNGATLAVSAWDESSAAIGIGGNQADNTAPGAGAVYVFTRSGVAWSQQAYIKASNTDAGDQFGVSVALSADGTILAVGAWNEFSAATGIGGNQADNTAGFAGAVYVFTRSGATWTQQAYVKASNTNAGDEFGFSVALSADGTTLAVGALLESSAATGIGGNQADNSANGAGAVYVFTRSGQTWSQHAYIKASNTDAGDAFASVALSTDGTTLAVGAAGEDSAATGIGGDQADNSSGNPGAVYVFY
jgi:cysteine-rich repeat protein